MAILKPSEVPSEVILELPPHIESEINDNLSQGIREWLMDTEWLPEKTFIIKCLKVSGWSCKIEQRPSADDEVKPYWITLKPI